MLRRCPQCLGLFKCPTDRTAKLSTKLNLRIDLIEERNGELKAFEFKWGDKKPKCPSSFKDNYPDVPFTSVNKSNFIDFVTK